MEVTTKFFKDTNKQVQLLKYLQQELTRTPSNSTGTVKDLILKAEQSGTIKQLIEYLPGLIIWLELSKFDRKTDTNPSVRTVHEAVKSKWGRLQPLIFKYAVAFLLNETYDIVTDAHVKKFFKANNVSAQGTNRGIVLKDGQIYAIEQYETRGTNPNKGIHLFNVTNRLENVNPAPGTIFKLKPDIKSKDLPVIPAPAIPAAMDAGDGGGVRNATPSPRQSSVQFLRVTPPSNSSSLSSLSPEGKEMMRRIIDNGYTYEELFGEAASSAAAASAAAAAPPAAAASTAAAASPEETVFFEMPLALTESDALEMLDIFKSPTTPSSKSESPLALTGLRAFEVQQFFASPKTPKGEDGTTEGEDGTTGGEFKGDGTSDVEGVGATPPPPRKLWPGFSVRSRVFLLHM